MQIFQKIFVFQNLVLHLQSQTGKDLHREHSSVGLERLPYKQRVGGSTPSAPTRKILANRSGFFYRWLLCLNSHPDIIDIFGW